MDSYFFILTTIDLFVLGFMSLLTKLSESLNKKQKRGFLLAFALIACISVLEVITIVVDGAPTGCRWLNILSNYLGFGLTPAVALCLVYVLDKKSIIRRGFKAAVCCEGAYLLFLAATLPYGLVFSVSRENLYARGEYFYIYVAMYYAAMLYLMVATVRTAAAFQNRSRTLIYPLTLFLGAETVIQIALPSLHVTWLCVTLLSVLYYIYCSEMWNQLDALTGLLNQNSYLNRTAEMRRSGGVLVVFDVDDFKQINDRYGHLQGDVCLAEIADCIKKAYARCGYCYRIGGDEFCVLLRDEADEARCAAALQSLLAERRKEITLLPTLSLGSAVFSGEDVVTVKDRADRALYCAKNELKARAAAAMGKRIERIIRREKTPAHFINGGTPMITDWNSPQGDFDPTEKQGELLMLLSGQQVTVHTSAEDDFDYMENEDVAFVVKNPHSEEDLLIELCGEFSVFFEKWHGEYPATEEGYAQMTQDVQAVLAGSAGALSLYTEDGWQGTALCTEKPGPDADAAGLLERCWSAEKPHKPLEKGSRVELVYWDPAQNRTLTV